MIFVLIGSRVEGEAWQGDRRCWHAGQDQT